jgi:Methylase involved in ubiquinone/menaquinone biosynthesis
MLLPPPPRVEREERIDSAVLSEDEFAGTFTDMARINRFLGGTAATVRELARMITALPGGGDRPVRILDVATGGADVPRDVAAAARRGRFGGRAVSITAIDNHAQTLALARRWTPEAAWPEIRLESADLLHLPYPDGAFDIALCSLALHHLGPQGGVAALRELERVTCAGFLVNDLVRSRTNRFLAWLVTRVAFVDPISQHDAPVSVMRAFTPNEYSDMAKEAGIPDVVVRAVPMCRALLVRDRNRNGRRQA